MKVSGRTTSVPASAGASTTLESSTSALGFRTDVMVRVCSSIMMEKESKGDLCRI
jgi:hypothetical protein